MAWEAGVRASLRVRPPKALAAGGGHGSWPVARETVESVVKCETPSYSAVHSTHDGV